MQDDLKIDSYFIRILSRPPQAIAQLAGDVSHPNLSGTVKFYQLGRGVLLSAYFTGLPTENSSCPHRVFGLHIHEKGDCSGNELDPFANVGSHYNPAGCQHPDHAGDLPPLIASGDQAWFAFYTDHFSLWEVLGRAVVVHTNRDDFTTQPAGDSGSKIGCGTIQRVDPSPISRPQHTL